MVEDGNKFDRIPKIHGVLAFRQDNQSLYIRKNESWKVVAEDEKVGGVNYRCCSKKPDHLSTHETKNYQVFSWLHCKDHLKSQ